VREREGWDWSVRWMLLSFDTEEVLAVWPPYLHQADLAIESPMNLPGSKPDRTDRVHKWLLNYVSTEHAPLGGPPKSDEALRACRTAMSCTYRAALAAWGALPPGTKRPARSRPVGKRSV